MKSRKKSLLFVFITVFIDCMGMRIVFPGMASLITQVSGVNVNDAIIYSGWLMVSYALMQFVFSPVLGALSDVYGRRPILLLSLFGLGLDYLFLSVANTLPLLFAGRIIAGICGSSLTTGFAYVADITKPEERAQSFGLISAAVGLGFIIGPFLGGLFSEFGIRIPFVVAAILSLVNLLYGFFILPESLASQNRAKFNLSRLNPFRSFIFFKEQTTLQPLLISLFFVYLSAQALPSIWPFYTKYLYKWSDLEIGYSLTFVGLLVAIVKSGLIKWSQNKFGSVNSVHIGLIFSILGLGLFAFANQPWMVYVFALVYCMGGIATPSLQGIISNKMASNQQGELQGVITSFVSLANILSPILMTHIFSFCTKNQNFQFPGIPFIVSAVIIFFSFLLFAKARKSTRLFLENTI